MNILLVSWILLVKSKFVMNSLKGVFKRLLKKSFHVKVYVTINVNWSIFVMIEYEKGSQSDIKKNSSYYILQYVIMDKNNLHSL